MREGLSVYESFRRGQAAVPAVGFENCSTSDPACQEPWLDDNGNGIPNESGDGQLAQQRGLTTWGGWKIPQITSLRVGAIDERGQATIETRVLASNDLAQVQAMIISPTQRVVISDYHTLPILTGPTVTLTLSGTDTYAGQYAGFTDYGSYRVIVHAWDVAGLTATPQSVVISKNYPVYLPIIWRE
jgi:hypothetical protein